MYLLITIIMSSFYLSYFVFGKFINLFFIDKFLVVQVFNFLVKEIQLLIFLSSFFFIRKFTKIKKQKLPRTLLPDCFTLVIKLL